MLKACPCGCIDAKPDKSPENYIACGRGYAATDNLPRNRDLLRNETRLLKGGDKLFVLLDCEGTRRHASKSVTGVDLSAARRRVEPNAVSGPANYSSACTA